MSHEVFVEGREATTGFQIGEWFAGRTDSDASKSEAGKRIANPAM